jgi:hypothetical protein
MRKVIRRHQPIGAPSLWGAAGRIVRAVLFNLRVSFHVGCIIYFVSRFYDYAARIAQRACSISA